MQEVAYCQPFKLIFFTMFLRQDTLYQVLHKWVPPIFVSEDSIAFLLICCKLTSLALGLDLVRVLTHAQLIETCPLESAVEVDFSIELASSVMYFPQFSLGLIFTYTSQQDPSRHPTVQFSFHQGKIFQRFQLCQIFLLHQGFLYRNPPILFAYFFLESLLWHFNDGLLSLANFYLVVAFFKCYM